jgi:type VI secretion system secreted protein VgrG
LSTAGILLEIDGVDAEIKVSSCEVDERIGAAVIMRVSAAAFVAGELAELAPLDPVGRSATLTLHFHDVERRFKGVVDAVEERSGRTEITLITPVGRLADTRDYRVFVDSSATEIATRVLGEHRIRVSWRARRAAPKRAHCVQVFESDLAFCARLLAEEGMSWFPEADAADAVVVADLPDTFPDPGTTIPFRLESGLEVGRALHSARLTQQIAVETATLRDYDFRHPTLDLTGTAGKGSLEWYEYPGGFTTASEGGALAAIRLGEREAESLILEGSATEPELRAGAVFTLSHAPDELPEARWLVLSVIHEARRHAAEGELTYSARFRAVPASKGYRPQRLSPGPRGGVGTAVVTGAPGQEIALDEFGRTRVLLRWDRRNAADAQSSGFARVAQPQLSGSIFNPRVGWEELVGFPDAGGEIPLLLGRVYNAVQAPPASLPAKKVESHFGTMTTPAGSSGNFLQISDDAGKEGMSLNASGVYNERTENDKVTAIGVNDVRNVAGSRTRIVNKDLVESVAGDQSILVGGLRSVTAGSDYGVAAGSERVMVGGARIISTGGDYLTKTPTFVRLVGGAKQEIGVEHQSITTTGASTLLVGGSVSTVANTSEAVAVGGGAVVKVSGCQTINTGAYALTVTGVYSESFGSRTATAAGDVGEGFGKVTYDIGGAAAFTGAAVSVEASGTLTIKAGGVTIVMTSGSITVQGNLDGSTPSVEEGSHRYG